MKKYKRVFELNPGDKFLYFGHEFEVTICENGFIYYKPVGSTKQHYGHFGWKGKQVVEIINTKIVVANDKKRMA